MDWVNLVADQFWLRTGSWPAGEEGELGWVHLERHSGSPRFLSFLTSVCSHCSGSPGVILPPHTAKPLLLIFPPPFQGSLMLDLPQDRLVASGDGGGRLTPLCAVDRPGPNYIWNPGE